MQLKTSFWFFFCLFIIGFYLWNIGACGYTADKFVVISLAINGCIRSFDYKD